MATIAACAASCREATSSSSRIRRASRRRSDRERRRDEAGKDRSGRRSGRMSLLLEALKKAEKAKEEAQRRARGETGAQGDASSAQPVSQPAAARGGELTLEGQSAPQPDAKRVMTRAELPDISAPLEIVSDDLGDKTPPRPREELRLETSREPLRRGTPTFFQAGVQP